MNRIIHTLISLRRNWKFFMLRKNISLLKCNDEPNNNQFLFPSLFISSSHNKTNRF